MNPSQKERLFQTIEESTGRMIALQRELTAVPAIAPESGGQGEAAKAQVLCNWLHDLGWNDIERHDAPDARVAEGIRPNIVATLPGRTTTNLWIMSHLDIVPPGDLALWASDPYLLVEEKGILRGRGVEDNQQAIVSSLFAAQAIRDSGIRPETSVKLLFLADEESANTYGIEYLLAKKLISIQDAVLVPDWGRELGDMIQIAEKSLLWLRIQTRGRQCHAANPQQGVNAMVAASDLVLRLNELNGLYPEQDPLFDPPRSSLTPTRRLENVPDVNTIPADDVFYLDCRILPSVELERILDQVRRVCRVVEGNYGVTVNVSVEQRMTSPPTPSDTPLITALTAAVREVNGIQPRVRGVGGGTVASYLRRAGIPAAVWTRIEGSAHQPNETCRVENMVGDAKVMALLMAGGL